MARESGRVARGARSPQRRANGREHHGAALSLGVLGAWAYFGIYQLEPGQAAVILRFGKYVHTVSEPGLRWHLPPPIEDHEIVNVASIDREEFGYGAAQHDADRRTKSSRRRCRRATRTSCTSRSWCSTGSRTPSRRATGSPIRGRCCATPPRPPCAAWWVATPSTTCSPRSAASSRPRPRKTSSRRSTSTSRGSRCSASSCRTCSRPSRCGPPSTTCSAPCRTATAP